MWRQLAGVTWADGAQGTEENKSPEPATSSGDAQICCVMPHKVVRTVTRRGSSARCSVQSTAIKTLLGRQLANTRYEQRNTNAYEEPRDISDCFCRHAAARLASLRP